MKVIDIINSAVAKGETRFAFELLPPLKGETISSIYDTIDLLTEFKPAYINVTYHREDLNFIKHDDGRIERRIVRRRPGTVGISAAIMVRYGVEVVPHLICGGCTKYDIENALIEMNFLGLHNVLALRGDKMKSEDRFNPTEYGYANANGVVTQISNMNNGLYIDNEIDNSHATDFCVGVAGYPEGHGEAANLDQDLKNLKTKVDAGADYIVTQMFFDNRKFFSFVERCRAAGITVPIIPGLKPLSTKGQLSILPDIFNITLPEELISAVEACENNDQVRRVGVEWAVAQSRELKAAGVPVLHFYTMGRPDSMIQIAKQIFL